MNTMPSWRLQRVFDGWQQGQARLARWAVATFLFAAVTPLLVLAPFERTTREAGRLAQRIETLAATRDDQDESIKKLESVRATLDDVARSLQAFSWSDRRAELVGQMQQLGRGYETLSTLSDADLEKAISRTVIQDTSRHGASGLDTRQMPPDLNLNATSNLAARSRDDLAAEENAAAFRDLSLSPAALKATPIGLRDAVLDTAVRASAQAVVDAAVKSAASDARSLLQPIRAAMSQLNDPERGALEAELAQVTASIDTWESEHVGNKEWWSTVEGKGAHLSTLAQRLRRGEVSIGGETWVDRGVATLNHRKERATVALASLRSAVAQTEADLGKNAEATKQLRDKLRNILPKWLGDLIAPEQLMPLYPPAILVLALLLAFGVWQTRIAFHSLRRSAQEEGIALGDLAETSVLTLARRSPTASAVTFAFYLGAIATLAFLFEYGASLAISTGTNLPAAIAGDPVLGLFDPSLVLGIRPWGRAIFLTAAAAVIVVMVRDGRRAASAA